jgi:AraC-like DNA-binding protein
MGLRGHPGDVSLRTTLVDEVWSVRLEPGTQHTVLPDGCMDLVYRDGSDPALFWVGPMTRAEVVRAEEPTRFLGVRFRPGVAPALLGCDAREMLDLDVPAGDSRLLGALVGASSDAVRGDLLLSAVLRRGVVPDALVTAVSATILSSGGALRVADLARTAGLSERTLHRRFAAAVGYGPKQLCRIARLGVARRLGRQGVSGARLAAEAGYCDQAHLCHELASFGLSSTALVS